MKQLYVDAEVMKKFKPNHVHQYYYRKLRIEMAKQEPNLTLLTFLTGMVHAFRVEGFRVSEIEDCFLYIKKKTGCELICS